MKTTPQSQGYSPEVPEETVKCSKCQNEFPKHSHRGWIITHCDNSSTEKHFCGFPCRRNYDKESEYFYNFHPKGFLLSGDFIKRLLAPSK